MSAGNAHTCALDDAGVHCWGWNEHGQLNVPPLKNPKMVSAGVRHTCAIDEDGVRCWGDNSSGQTNAPHLITPWSVSAGSLHSCALDENGAHCWGYVGSYSNLPVLSLGLVEEKDPHFQLGQTFELGIFLAKVSSPVRTAYLGRLKDFAKNRLSIANQEDGINFSRYLMISLYSPLVISNDAPYFVRTLTPAFRESVKSIGTELGVNTISEIPDGALNREIALRALQASLSVMAELSSSKNREQIQPALRSLGRAMPMPLDQAKIRDALASIAAISPILEEFAKNPKSAFLVHTLQMAAVWLAGKK